MDGRSFARLTNQEHSRVFADGGIPEIFPAMFILFFVETIVSFCTAAKKAVKFSIKVKVLAFLKAVEGWKDCDTTSPEQKLSPNQCQRWNEAHTKVHDRAWALIISELKQKLPAEWALHVEKPMFLVGLKLENAQETVLVQRESEKEPALRDVKNWRPDCLAIPWSRMKKDHQFKLTKCDPLQIALKATPVLVWKLRSCHGWQEFEDLCIKLECITAPISGSIYFRIELYCKVDMKRISGIFSIYAAHSL